MYLEIVLSFKVKIAIFFFCTITFEDCYQKGKLQWYNIDKSLKPMSEQSYLQVPFCPQSLPEFFIIIYLAGLLCHFRPCLCAEQAVSAQGDPGVCASGAVCPSGSGHLHHQCGCHWTGLCQARRVSAPYTASVCGKARYCNYMYSSLKPLKFMTGQS